MYVAIGNSPQPLKLDEIPKAIRVRKAAFRDDPSFRYIFDTPDARHTRIIELVRDLRDGLNIAIFVPLGGVWAIEGGAGFIVFQHAEKSLSRRRKILQHVLHKLFSAASRPLVPVLYSKEQLKRAAEVVEKERVVYNKAFGGQLDEMLGVTLLAVSPEKQGLGYGSALLQVAIAEADAQRRSTWLSTRPATVGFYQQFGFFVVGEYTLGEDNPTWKEDPVERVVMMREPRPLEMSLADEKSAV